MSLIVVVIVTFLIFSNSVRAFRLGGKLSGFRKLSVAPKISTTALNANTADFKNGLTIELDGVPTKLLEFLHVKPGKGSAFVRTKVRNLLNGSVQERTFRAGETIIFADIAKVDMQYTFTDGDMVCFMNMESFEEERLEKKMIDNLLLLKEGLECKVTIWNEKVIGVDLPQNVEYKVVDTPPNFKGNTAQGGTKPAVVEGGATVNVPMFIENGEVILVSTVDCKYLNRVGGYSADK